MPVTSHVTMDGHVGRRPQTDRFSVWFNNSRANFIYRIMEQPECKTGLNNITQRDSFKIVPAETLSCKHMNLP